MKTAYGLEVSKWRWFKYYLLNMHDEEIHIHGLKGLSKHLEKHRVIVCPFRKCKAKFELKDISKYNEHLDKCPNKNLGIDLRGK